MNPERPTWLGASSLRTVLCLLLLLSAGAAVRYYGIDFGMPALTARPDEETSIRSAVYMIQNGTLKPTQWIYPSFFTYLTLAVNRTAEYLLPHVSPPRQLERIYLEARCISAMFGSLTILLVYLLGRKLLSPRAGLLAALILAFAHLHVRDSHFGTTDATVTFFMTLGLFPILDSARSDSFKPAILAGIAAGLAAGTKYTGMVLLVPLFTAVLFRFFQRRAYGAALARFGAAIGAAFIFFMATNPYALLEPGSLLDEFIFIWHATSPIKWSFAESGFVQYFTICLPYGLGLAVCLAAVLGGASAIARRKDWGLVIAAFILVYYICMGRDVHGYPRYLMPLVPILCVLAALGLEWMGAALLPRKSGQAALVLTALALISPASRVAASDRLLAETDTRVLAAQYLDKLVKEGEHALLIGRFSIPAVSICRKPRFETREMLSLGENELACAFSGRYDYVIFSSYFFETALEMTGAVREKLLPSFESIRVFSPLKEGSTKEELDPVLCDQDVLYLPYAHFEGFERPGPFIHVCKRIGVR